MSIYTKTKKIASEELVSFYMPGHKNGRMIEDYYVDNSVFKCDITEIPGADDLYNPSGAIGETHRDICKFYESDESFMLVNGSTCGIMAMIMAATEKNDRVMVYRNSHKSVYKALVLNELIPNYFMPIVNEKYDILEDLDYHSIESTLKENKIKALIVTYPTYEGVCFDIEKLSQICRSYDTLLLVDGAHGAHFKISDLYPTCSVESKADVVVNSFHKTLPAMTQTAVIHVNGEKINRDKLKFYLETFQTSSPSYLLMNSIDIALQIVKTSGKELSKELIKNIKLLKEKINNETQFKIIDSNDIDCYDFDVSKILLRVEGNGKEIDEILRYEYSIQSEYSTKDYILLMTSIGNTKEDFFALSNALKEIDKKLLVTKDKKDDKGEKIGIYYKNLEIAKLPWESIFAGFEEIDIIESEGRISKDFISPYPPGVPLICPGEIIDSGLVDLLGKMLDNNYNINGINGRKVRVLLKV